MAALTTQVLGDTGAALTYAAVTASDTADVGNGRNTFLHVKNGGGASTTVTLLVPGTTFFGAATPDNEITIPAADERIIPLRKDYADDTNRATVTFNPTTSVTAAVVRLEG